MGQFTPKSWAASRIEFVLVPFSNRQGSCETFPSVPCQPCHALARLDLNRPHNRRGEGCRRTRDPEITDVRIKTRSTLLETLGVGSDEFPFGIRPVFRCILLSFGECIFLNIFSYMFIIVSRTSQLNSRAQPFRIDLRRLGFEQILAGKTDR